MSFPVFITLPRSKSIIIRCLIINYLKNGTLLPVFDDDPNDIKVVHNALKVVDSRKETSVNEECVIDVQDCGAAYRFLLTLLATTRGKWLLTGTERLLQRPIIPLVNFLKAKDARIKKTEKGWQIEGGKLQIDNFEIDTSETSQFASALMMVFGSRVREFKSSKFNPEFNSGQSSKPEKFYGLQNPYLKMTQTLLQTNNLSSFINLADWSAAVFWLANALLMPNAHYLLRNLHFDELQGDAIIASRFEKWGLVFTENEDGIEVKHVNQVDIPEQEIDVTQTPDLAMILAVLSICYPFQLTLSGMKNLNLKESKRLDVMVKELSRFTKIEKLSEDTITFYKRTITLPETFKFNSYNDHRFVMAWSLFKKFGIVIIENPECIKKSYPNF